MLDLIKIRHDLHQIPETGWQEKETSEYLNNVITYLINEHKDIEITRYKTGFVVYIPGTEGKKTIGWRTDIDGLPTNEETGLTFTSKHKGTMHACGHDVHMAVALGFLEYVLQNKQKNNILILFQPAEEDPGGAEEMYDNIIEPKYKVDEFYAMHDSPEWEPGIITTKTGELFAGLVALKIEFVGIPGHGAMPHMTRDPLVAAASFLLEVQTLISRNLDPLHAEVLTFGTINGGTAPNSVAKSCDLTGTLRIGSKQSLEFSKKRIAEIAQGVAQAIDVKVNIEIHDSYYPVINNLEITNKFINWMRTRTDFKFQEAPITMTSEDYGYIISKVPGMMFWLGVGGKEKGISLHSSKFSPDENIIIPVVRLIGEYISSIS
ncbi:MAG: amidohydrolase [Endomicrobium sp.]|jgi:N-acetyldiaminopimelate deacetylase|nr:amidohydrolase [Endomicrobium sp.]MDR2399945.1 amidohydrolase [Endomicrobium sp.]